MNGVREESGLRMDLQRKERMWEGIGCRKKGEEDEWSRREADCGWIRREMSKNGRLLGAGRREGSRWNASGVRAECERICREKSKIEGCYNAVGARGQ